MDDLVQRVSAATGLEPETARNAIGIVLRFAQREGSPEASGPIFDKVPGARELAAAAAAEDDAGGLSGSPGDGLMGLVGELTSVGISMGQIQILGREMFAYLRGHAGAEAVGRLAASIPGLSQFT